MRYTLIFNTNSLREIDIATHGMITMKEGEEVTMYIKDGQMLHLTGPYAITPMSILYTAADGVIITKRNITPIREAIEMLLPETHPLFNFGVIAEREVSYDVKLRECVANMAPIFNRKLFKLFNNLKQNI